MTSSYVFIGKASDSPLSLFTCYLKSWSSTFTSPYNYDLESVQCILVLLFGILSTCYRHVLAIKKMQIQLTLAQRIGIRSFSKEVSTQLCPPLVELNPTCRKTNKDTANLHILWMCHVLINWRNVKAPTTNGLCSNLAHWFYSIEKEILLASYRYGVYSSLPLGFIDFFESGLFCSSYPEASW